MNKKVFLNIIMALAIVQTISAQSTDKHDLPALVSTKFYVTYPGVQIKQWKYYNGTYDIKYREEHKAHTAYFSHNGEWEKTVSEFMFTHSLPVVVQNGLRANGFASYYFEKIKEVDSVGNHYFDILADSYPPSTDEDSFCFKQYDLRFSSKGVLIKETLLPFE